MMMLYYARRRVMYAMCVKYGSTPLICAASNGHLDIVKVLLAAGADITAKHNVSVIHYLPIAYHTSHHY